jgi:hypothetical protein
MPSSGGREPGEVAHDLTTLLGPLGVSTTAQLAGRVDRHTVSS